MSCLHTAERNQKSLSCLIFEAFPYSSMASMYASKDIIKVVPIVLATLEHSKQAVYVSPYQCK